MYKFTITDVQMLKSNGNEEFASLIEIMIQDEHACISGDLGIEIQSAVDAAKAAEAAAAAAATEISLENVVEMLNVYIECDEEVRKVLYSIGYLVSCSYAVPELVERKARALLEAKQTEAAAQLAPDAEEPSSPASSGSAQTPTKAAAAYGGDGASPGGKPKKKEESAPVIGGVYDWDDVKQYFFGEMCSKGCLVSTDSGLESVSTFSNAIVQRYTIKTKDSNQPEPYVRSFKKTKRTISKSMYKRRRKHIEDQACRASEVASASTYEAVYHRLQDRLGAQRRKQDRLTSGPVDVLKMTRMVPFRRKVDASNAAAAVQRIGTEIMVVSALCRIKNNIDGYIIEHVKEKKVLCDKKTAQPILYPHGAVLVRDLLVDTTAMESAAPAEPAVAPESSTENNGLELALMGMQMSAQSINDRASDQMNPRGTVAAAKNRAAALTEAAAKRKNGWAHVIDHWDSGSSSGSASSTSSTSNSGSNSGNSGNSGVFASDSDTEIETPLRRIQSSKSRKQAARKRRREKQASRKRRRSISDISGDASSGEDDEQDSDGELDESFADESFEQEEQQPKQTSQSQSRKKKKVGAKWQPGSGDTIEVWFEDEQKFYAGTAVKTNFSSKLARTKAHGTATKQKSLTLYAGCTHVFFPSDQFDFAYSLMLESYDLEPELADDETIWRYPEDCPKHEVALQACVDAGV